MNYIGTIYENEIKNGEHKKVKVKDKEILIFKLNDNITAISNTCLHKGGPLSEGKVEKKYGGYYITCPWHGWEYNLVTGKAPPGYEEQQAMYEVIVKDNKIHVSEKPIILPFRGTHKENPLQDLIELKYDTSSTSLNILGISTTNINQKLPRVSTSELVLQEALDYARREYQANTVMIRLSDIEFRHCEGYYSRNEMACTWPCSISKMDSNDGMNDIYRKMILWADIVVVSTPIRWGNASSLYYKMIERLNCVQNQITLHNRVLVKNKVASFIITGGQDNIQSVAGQMMMFFSELGFALPPYSFMGWSRGWIAEDMEHNVQQFKKSRYIKRSLRDLVDNDIKLLRQLKGDPCIHINFPQPKIVDASSYNK